MKRILLTSTALVGFAGVAAADGHAANDGVSFSGTADLEYNTGGDGFDSRDEGFDWGVDLNIGYSRALDNGLTAGVAMELDIVDDEVNGSGSLDVSDFVLSLTGDNAGLYFGDTETAAGTHWTSAGDMEQDGFSVQDGGAGDVILRGDMTFGGVDMSIGAYVGDDGSDGSYTFSDAELEQISLGLTAAFGSVNVAFAYQEEGPSALEEAADYNGDEIFGFNVSTMLGGATVELGYATNQTDDEDSLGLQVSYPVGDMVTLGAYYVDESSGDANMGVSVAYSSGPVSATVYYEDDQGSDGYGFDLDYDLGNGIMVMAGYQDGDNRDDDGFYLGASYDLGGDATLELVHVELDATRDGDGEYFEGDWEDGTTLALSFSF